MKIYKNKYSVLCLFLIIIIVLISITSSDGNYDPIQSIQSAGTISIIIRIVSALIMWYFSSNIKLGTPWAYALLGLLFPILGFIVIGFSKDRNITIT